MYNQCSLDECVNTIAVQLVNYAQMFAQNTSKNFLKIHFFQCFYYVCIMLQLKK